MYRKRSGKTRYKYDKNVISGWKNNGLFYFLLYTFLCNFSLNHTYKSGFGGLYKEVTQ